MSKGTKRGLSEQAKDASSRVNFNFSLKNILSNGTERHESLATHQLTQCRTQTEHAKQSQAEKSSNENLSFYYCSIKRSLCDYKNKCGFLY